MSRRRAATGAERFGAERLAARGHRPHAFQREAWRAWDRGEEGLIHAATGTGKTLAAWLGPLASIREAGGPRGLEVLWITPLRALATDLERALAEAAAEIAPEVRVERRTGDVGASMRKRQRERPPACLVTTPESLSVLLSYADAPRAFRHLRAVVVDEWHELMGTKRGVQTELGLAALRGFAPELRTWGLSATIGNLDEAMETLLGPGRAGRRIESGPRKCVVIETLIPDAIERYPWSGHLGTRLTDRVLASIRAARTTLLFTNTRSQAEAWFQAILRAAPDLLGAAGLHHGSLDRAVRQEVERLLREERLRVVVCTSSLDLGVNFPAVDQVVQVGSPKGIGRLLQRAGRSGHRPGVPSRVIGVPTNALELIEFAAARDRIATGSVEPRRPIERPMDVLVQHVVTRALGGGVAPEGLLAEVRGTRAFRDLTDAQWAWALAFTSRGGDALAAYPRFRRATLDEAGQLRVPDVAIARNHRLGIGTIASDAALSVRFVGGRTIGTVEESFVAHVRPGDRFVFAGRVLELVRVREMTVQVRTARARSGRIPRWVGGRSPLSTHLADAVRDRVDRARLGERGPREMRAIAPLLALQARVSRLPAREELLLERVRTRDGDHAFLFPLAGRLAQEGLGALLAHRLTRRRRTSVTAVATDWGIELLSRHPLPDDPAEWRELLAPANLLEDLLACLDTTELARRHFREVARIAGLIVPAFPGRPRSNRDLQASSGLFYDVLTEHDPGNLLVAQAQREVLDRELEVARLRELLERCRALDLRVVATEGLSPFAFPIWTERIRAQHVTSESWQDRVREMLDRLESAKPDRTDGPAVEVRATAAAPRGRRGARAGRAAR